jgi:hypothetical protein
MNKHFSMFSGFNFFGKKNKYNPLINYDWSTKNTRNDYVVADKELIDNGNFNSNDLTGWTSNYVTASVQNGVLFLTGTASVPANQVFWTKSVDLIVGKRYKLTSKLVSLSNTTGWNLFGLKFVDTGLGYKYVTSTGNYEFVLEATGVLGKIGHHCSTSPGNTASFDDTSLKEIITEPNVRYLTDKGKSPKYDALLYFGQGVYFNGVDQGIKDIPYTIQGQKISLLINAVTISYSPNQYIYNAQLKPLIWRTNNLIRVYIDGVNHDVCNIGTATSIGNIALTIDDGILKFYLNGVLKYTAPCGEVATTGFSKFGYDGYSSAYTTGILKDAYMFNRVLSQSEITQSYEQPEAFYSMAQADTTCVLNMPMCEKDGYIRNMKTYSEGDNFSGVTIGSQTMGTGNSITQNNNTFNITNVVSTGQVYYPLVKFPPDVFNSDLYYQEIEVKCVTGTLKVGAIEGNPATAINEVLTAGQSRVYAKVSGFANYGGQKGVMYLDGLNYPSFTAEVTLKNVRKITNGIKPIQNYTTACRTSAQNLSYGLQTCKFNRDSLGVVKGINVGIECRGIGYATTGWTPPINDNFSIECIMNFNNDLQYNFNGSQVSAVNRFMFGQDLTGLNARLLINSQSVFKYSIGIGYHLFSITRSGTTFNLSVDGIFIGSITETLLALNSFYLGRANPNSFPLTNNNIRLFKVHDKALTQAEIARNYNSYVAKGLLA